MKAAPSTPAYKSSYDASRPLLTLKISNYMIQSDKKPEVSF